MSRRMKLWTCLAMVGAFVFALALGRVPGVASAADSSAVSPAEGITLEAQAFYAVTHITNESKAPATLYVRRGNGPWQRQNPVQKGHTRTLSVDVPAGQKAAPLFVRIDIDTDGVRYVEYELSQGPSPDQFGVKSGHRFVITQVQGAHNRFIQAMPPAQCRATGAEGRP